MVSKVYFSGDVFYNTIEKQEPEWTQTVEKYSTITKGNISRWQYIII